MFDNILDQPIGFILRDFIKLTQEQQNEAFYLQIKFLAIKQNLLNNPDYNYSTLDTVEKVNQKLKELEITYENLIKLRDNNQGTNMPNGVPLYGECIVKYLKFVPELILEALLIAQAAQRIKFSIKEFDSNADNFSQNIELELAKWKIITSAKPNNKIVEMAQYSLSLISMLNISLKNNELNNSTENLEKIKNYFTNLSIYFLNSTVALLNMNSECLNKEKFIDFKNYVDDQNKFKVNIISANEFQTIFLQLLPIVKTKVNNELEEYVILALKTLTELNLEKVSQETIGMSRKI